MGGGVYPLHVTRHVCQLSRVQSGDESFGVEGRDNTSHPPSRVVVFFLRDNQTIQVRFFPSLRMLGIGNRFALPAAAAAATTILRRPTAEPASIAIGTTTLLVMSSTDVAEELKPNTLSNACAVGQGSEARRFAVRRPGAPEAVMAVRKFRGRQLRLRAVKAHRAKITNASSSATVVREGGDHTANRGALTAGRSAVAQGTNVVGVLRRRRLAKRRFRVVPKSSSGNRHQEAPTFSVLRRPKLSKKKSGRNASATATTDVNTTTKAVASSLPMTIRLTASDTQAAAGNKAALPGAVAASVGSSVSLTFECPAASFTTTRQVSVSWLIDSDTHSLCRETYSRLRRPMSSAAVRLVEGAGGTASAFTISHEHRSLTFAVHFLADTSRCTSDHHIACMDGGGKGSGGVTATTTTATTAVAPPTSTSIVVPFSCLLGLLAMDDLDRCASVLQMPTTQLWRAVAGDPSPADWARGYTFAQYAERIQERLSFQQAFDTSSLTPAARLRPGQSIPSASVVINTSPLYASNAGISHPGFKSQPWTSSEFVVGPRAPGMAFPAVDLSSVTVVGFLPVDSSKKRPTTGSWSATTTSQELGSVSDGLADLDDVVVKQKGSRPASPAADGPLPGRSSSPSLKGSTADAIEAATNRRRSEEDIADHCRKLLSSLERRGFAIAEENALVSAPAHSVRHGPAAAVQRTIRTRQLTMEAIIQQVFKVIKHTHYGGTSTWGSAVTAPSPSDQGHLDLAYANACLALHTDNTYFTEPAKLQGFGLVHSTADTRGGETTLCDGLAVARAMYERYTRDFWLLTRVPVTARYVKEGRAFENAAPVISLCPRHNNNIHSTYSVSDAAAVGSSSSTSSSSSPRPPPPPPPGSLSPPVICRIAYNSIDSCPIAAPHIAGLSATQVDAFYAAYERFGELCRSPEFSIGFSLKEGQVLFFDNYRVLHAREHYTGPRVMAGAYVGLDDYRSAVKSSAWFDFGLGQTNHAVGSL